MKPWIKVAIMAVVVIATAISAIGTGRTINRLTAERDKYKGNTTALLSDVERYRVQDSLNAAQVQSLELTIKEFERFRAEDAELIQQLKARNRDLAAVNKTQSQTIVELRTVPRDTVIIRDSAAVQGVAVHCGDAWFDFDGVLTADEFTGTMVNRDSLLFAETIKYKRFLGFLWRTGIKDRHLDVISRNPHTTIVGLEHVIIEK